MSLFDIRKRLAVLISSDPLAIEDIVLYAIATLQKLLKADQLDIATDMIAGLQSKPTRVAARRFLISLGDSDAQFVLSYKYRPTMLPPYEAVIDEQFVGPVIEIGGYSVPAPNSLFARPFLIAERCYKFDLFEPWDKIAYFDAKNPLNSWEAEAEGAVFRKVHIDASSDSELKAQLGSANFSAEVFPFGDKTLMVIVKDTPFFISCTTYKFVASPFYSFEELSFLLSILGYQNSLVYNTTKGFFTLRQQPMPTDEGSQYLAIDSDLLEIDTFSINGIHYQVIDLSDTEAAHTNDLGESSIERAVWYQKIYNRYYVDMSKLVPVDSVEVSDYGIGFDGKIVITTNEPSRITLKAYPISTYGGYAFYPPPPDEIPEIPNLDLRTKSRTFKREPWMRKGVIVGGSEIISVQVDRVVVDKPITSEKIVHPQKSVVDRFIRLNRASIKDLVDGKNISKWKREYLNLKVSVPESPTVEILRLLDSTNYYDHFYYLMTGDMEAFFED